MQQWISRLRTQKARSRLRDTERRAPFADRRPWPQRLIDMALGLLGWIAICVLLYSGKPWPDDIPGAIQFSGEAIFLFVGVMICGIFLRVIDASILRGKSKVILCLLLLALFTLIPARLILFATDSGLIKPEVAWFTLPLALGPMLATILINSGAGAALGLWVTYTAAVFAGHSFVVFATGLVATGVAAYASRNVHKRSQVFRTGLMIGIAQVYVVVALAALQLEKPDIALQQVLACLLNGMVTTLVVLLILPIFEAVFGFTSDITLLELSDLSHPLLQRLATEAPGTYHHSLIVANLAQTATGEIGANGLLARVGAYFHDAGKLTKPELFIENNAASNPHDDLTPTMSALLITAHVKEGMSFGMLNKLPQVIMDMIRQHHGTSLVAYFHHKAQMQIHEQLQESERMSAPAVINDGDFRYPGPKPQTREAAILMLSDAVEAASRSLAKPTAHHLRHLVEEVVFGKVRDNQLAECHMTMDELSVVRESFIFTLTSMFHNRIPYPKHENRPEQPPKP